MEEERVYKVIYKGSVFYVKARSVMEANRKVRELCDEG